MINEAKQITTILLDGRIIKFPLDYSIKEGWVKFEVPKINKDSSLIEAGKSVNIKETESQEEITWESKKVFGKVELFYS